MARIDVTFFLRTPSLMKTGIKIFGLLAVAAHLGGCGSGSGGLGLTTGSLFGGGKAENVAAAAPVETPSMRAAQVAAVSARSAKCGYNYDPTRLKAGFLASEAQSGVAADVPKLEREYDAIRAKVAAALAADPDFCTDAKTQSIKSDLTRHMAGDYSAPANRKAIDERLLASGPRTREVLNPEFLTDKYASKTKRVEE